MGNMPVVDVGNRKVRVKRLLSEGGYAHVYKVSSTAGQIFCRIVAVVVVGRTERTSDFSLHSVAPPPPFPLLDFRL